MAEVNHFSSFLDTIRKYLVPPSLGGGHTEEEKEKVLEDYEKIKDKTWSDTAADIFGTGSNGFLLVGVILLIYLALKD